MDINVSDDLWKLIRPENKKEDSGLLCPGCIISRIENIMAVSYSAWNLVEIK